TSRRTATSSATEALFERGAAIDYRTIAEVLTRSGTYGRPAACCTCRKSTLATPSAAHIEHDARIVLEHAVRRRYIAAGQHVAELAWSRRTHLEESSTWPERRFRVCDVAGCRRPLRAGRRVFVLRGRIIRLGGGDGPVVGRRSSPV